MTSRQPKGSTIGGEFAPNIHQESTLVLVEMDLDSSGATMTISDDGSRRWMLNGQLHRTDGPAIEGADGDYWFLNGEMHRVDGPAIVWKSGTEAWYLNGKCHRDGGPAVTRADGTTEWWRDGTLDREDGPAMEWADGTNEWWGHGKLFMVVRPDGSAIHYFRGVDQAEVEEDEEAYA